VLGSLLVERVAWQRRLLEALVTLINFSSTNDNTYFAHFLAVRELERAQYELADERDFFGAESELTKRRIAADAPRRHNWGDARSVRSPGFTRPSLFYEHPAGHGQ
jgi:hypothetical protein